MRFLVFIFLLVFTLSAYGKEKDPLYDLDAFYDTTLSDLERYQAILHIRDVPYLQNKRAIDSLVLELEQDCGETDSLCCSIQILKSRFAFIEHRYVDFIPNAIELLNGDCEVSFRDSVLLIWSLAKSIENGGVYLESIKYRRKIEEMLPRYLDRYPNHLHYLSNMSDFYYSQGKFPEAAASYKSNLKYLIEHNKTFYMGTISNSIGVCYNNLNEPDSAIRYFNSALKYYVKYNNFDSAYIHGLVNGNIGQSYMLKGEYAKAIPLLLQDVYGSRELEKRNVFSSMMELAKCYKEIGNIEKAQMYVDTLNSFKQDEVLSYRVKLEFLTVKSEVYEETGQTDSTIATLQEIIEIIESNDREVAINQSNILVALYGVNEKQKIIDKQKIENQNAQLELVAKSRNQILTIGVSAGILLVLIVVLVAHNKVTKQKRQLQEKNDLNRASLEEKEVLLKEIHHRVKNNLQVVSGLLHLQSANIDSPELMAMIEEGQQRIESMALIHQMLYQDDGDVSVIDCQEYFEQLIGQIEHSYGSGKEIQITIDAEEVKLDLDYAIPLGLIINELTVNSFKYAFPDGKGAISVDLKSCEKKHFKMVFSDTGIGLKDVENVESMDSLGLRLVRMFCEEMDADLDVSNSPGATFEIFFKDCRKNEREG